MERFFMTRRRALAYLIKTQRELGAELGGHHVKETEQRHLDTLGRLIVDVRAARVDHFTLWAPEAIEIFVID